MSIYIKNISLSINGTPSDTLRIGIDGAKYRIFDLSLNQRLLEPCLLTFKLSKDTDEDIRDVQFSVCRTIIGKSVTLHVETASMEQQIRSFTEDSQNADIEFEGIITSAHGNRCESEYAIIVEAQTMDATLNDHPHCELYNDERLSDIIKDVLSRNGISGEVQPNHEEPIFYTAQYNETNYQFLRRMAIRYGEWMFSTGKKLHFGKLTNQGVIQLKYPSQDISEYSIHLQTMHPTFRYIGMGYNEFSKGNAYRGEEQDATGNQQNDSAFRASKQNYRQKTTMMMASAGLERDSVVEQRKMAKPEYIEEAEAERWALRSNMLVYEGTADCSRIQVGARLTIIDNYIYDSSINAKSEVQQDEILVTEVTHIFSFGDEYRNMFKGISAATNHPPYYNTTLYPVCNHPVRARVIDTNDPRHWGRVKVYFPWQNDKYQAGHKNGKTPWIHVMQPYANTIDQKNKFGSLLVPELNSVVLVDFEEGNFERPYVVGTHFGQLEPVDDAWYPGDNSVKAIRTASGHTIEIHDNIKGNTYDKGGYIRIYDNLSQNYEIFLSTDEKLIRLKSKGNIELYADRDIKMKAGQNVNVEAGNDYSLTAKRNIEQTAGNEYAQHAGTDMYIDSGNDMSVQTGNDMSVQVLNDRNMNVEHNDTMNVSENQFVTIGDNKDEQVENTLQVTANTIREEAKDQLLEYSNTHHQKATGSIGINAGANIDIKGANVKVN